MAISSKYVSENCFFFEVGNHKVDTTSYLGDDQRKCANPQIHRSINILISCSMSHRHELMEFTKTKIMQFGSAPGPASMKQAIFVIIRTVSTS